MVFVVIATMVVKVGEVICNQDMLTCATRNLSHARDAGSVLERSLLTQLTIQRCPAATL